MMSLPLNIAKRNPTENGMIRRLDMDMAQSGANGKGWAYGMRPEPDWRAALALRIGSGVYA